MYSDCRIMRFLKFLSCFISRSALVDYLVDYLVYFLVDYDVSVNCV